MWNSEYDRADGSTLGQRMGRMMICNCSCTSEVIYKPELHT